MKIIETTTAPNARRLRIFLAEKNIDIPIENIDLIETKSESFQKQNPMRRIPILILDDGTVIAESIAICRYLECLYPQPSLFGETPLQVAMIEMWQRRVELGLFHHIAQVLRHSNPKMAPFENPQILAWADANRPRALAALDVLDAQLAETDFVAGNTYSVADITALVAVDFMKAARIERPDGLANLNRWYDQVTSRASATA